MALLNLLREAPWLLREQRILSAPTTGVVILQTPQLFLATLDPMISLVGTVEGSSRPDATTTDRCFDDPDNLHPSH